MRGYAECCISATYLDIKMVSKGTKPTPAESRKERANRLIGRVVSLEPMDIPQECIQVLGKQPLAREQIYNHLEAIGATNGSKANVGRQTHDAGDEDGSGDDEPHDWLVQFPQKIKPRIEVTTVIK